jgi:FAD:protein FMN transferase
VTAVDAPAYRRVVEVMGTVVSFDVRPGTVSTARTGAAVDAALAWLRHVDETFSTYRPDSAVRRLADGRLALEDCPDEVLTVLRECEALRQQTDGWFDAYATGRLDPSGYVKGWAVEKASDLLASRGLPDHCVNAGGDVQCGGEQAPGVPWRIGIADPTRPGSLAGVVTSVPPAATTDGKTLAVATSGSAERGDHIRNPFGGAGSVGRESEPDSPTPVSVSLLGSTLTVLDAYANAAFARGRAAPSWLATLPVRSLVIAADGSVAAYGPAAA